MQVNHVSRVGEFAEFCGFKAVMLDVSACQLLNLLELPKIKSDFPHDKTLV